LFRFYLPLTRSKETQHFFPRQAIYRGAFSGRGAVTLCCFDKSYLEKQPPNICKASRDGFRRRWELCCRGGLSSCRGAGWLAGGLVRVAEPSPAPRGRRGFTSARRPPKTRLAPLQMLPRVLFFKYIYIFLYIYIHTYIYIHRAMHMRCARLQVFVTVFYFLARC